MVDQRVNLFVAAAALSLGAATQAAAGGCCPALSANCGCGPAPVVERLAVPVDPTPEIYVVNQGPIFSGPGPYLRREGPYEPPCCGYPYVGAVYTGYPYGLQNSGGYPRGTYSPFTGYPYVEGARSYVKYRMGYRPARVYARRIAPRVMPGPK
jgi:hypothetical protein